MTTNRKLTQLLIGMHVAKTDILPGQRLSITLDSGYVWSFATVSAAAGNALRGSIASISDDNTTVAITTTHAGVDSVTELALAANPAVIVRHADGTLAYAD